MQSVALDMKYVCPTEWWKVRHPTPAVGSDSEDSDIESDEDSAEFAVAAHDLDPKSRKAALQCSDGDKWQEAAKLEMDTHISNGTWKLVDLPPGAKCINSGWVFCLKHNADGSIERYKARLVAKGYSQRPGFDYNEVFAPTFRFAAIRTIIALAALNNLHLVIVSTISHLSSFCLYLISMLCHITNICYCLLAHVFDPESEYSTPQLLTLDSRYSSLLYTQYTQSVAYFRL